MKIAITILLVLAFVVIVMFILDGLKDLYKWARRKLNGRKN